MEKMINPKRQFVFMRLIAVTLVLVMSIGLVPVSAKTTTKEIPYVEVSSKAQLAKELKTAGEATIIFSTDTDAAITISSGKYSKKKNLVISAPYATITNKAKFASVTIEAVYNYTEKVSGNNITVLSDGSTINVFNKKKVSKLTVNANNDLIVLKEKASIKNLDTSQAYGILLIDESNYTVTISREEFDKYQQFRDAFDVYDLANEYYYKDTDPVKIAEGAAYGVLDALGDPYTFYYNPQEWADMWTDDEGNYAGIGIQISSDYETKLCTVSRVFKGSPAEKAGVQRNDILYKVGKDIFVTADNLDEVVKNNIRGIPGTTVDITFLRNGEEISYTISREDITVNQVESTLLGNDIGYIAMYQFAGQCELEFESALNNLISQGAKGIIIDLRDNGGGWVEQARYIGDLFLDEGELCYLVYKNGEESHGEYLTADGKIDTKLVILVNENTASSSEILTGALRDRADATIVGVKSFGKGIIQNVMGIGYNGAGCQITVAEYFTPSGYEVHKIGITPDYIVELPEGDNGMYDFADTKNDVQLKKAIEVMKQKLK
ncbi:MAG: S41 family peptidase [Lachnospiraceae bacterium]|nr:S41 family peptidase [Lachnospiraceae bacterium]